MNQRIDLDFNASTRLAPEGLGAIRFSLGRSTTRAEIDAVVEELVQQSEP